MQRKKNGLMIDFFEVFATVVILASIAGCGSGQSGGATANADPAAWVNADPVLPANANPVELDLGAFTVTNNDGSTVIHVPAGAYKVSKTLLLSSNTVLEGEGDATVLQAEAPFTGAQFITNADPVNGNKNIIIRNLKIAFGLPQLTGDEPGILRFMNIQQVEIDNLTMAVDSPMYGIDLAAQTVNAIVQGCTITNLNKVSGGGIMVRNGDFRPGRSTSGIVVQNNRIASASDEAVAAFGWEGIVENVRIENNAVVAYGASFGISIYGHKSLSETGEIMGVDIVGNSIEGGTVGAIGVMSGARQVNIVNNTVSQTLQDGIFIDPGGDGLPAAGTIAVTQNTISNIGRAGIYANGVDIQVEQNTISNCLGSGVYAAAGVSVIGNVISDVQYLIMAEVEDDAIIHDNIFPKGGDVLYLH